MADGDLRDLYQEVILDHSKHPRNCRKLDAPTCRADGHNPLCGDRVTVYVAVDADVIRDIAFEGAGCAICTASASMMTQALAGRTVAEAEALFEGFHRLLTTGEPPPGQGAQGPDLGKLRVFAGVRQYPIRVKCATLPWHTFHAALRQPGGTVSTE